MSFFTPRLSPEMLRKRETTAREKSAVLLDLYAPLVHRKDRVRELLSDDSDLPSARIFELEGLVRETNLKIQIIRNAAMKAEGGVDWPEHHVEHAVRVLTLLDVDRGREKNSVGWNPRESGRGHWICAAMRDDNDREIALRLARTMVGSYRKQLERPGVTEMFPLPSDWEMSK